VSSVSFVVNFLYHKGHKEHEGGTKGKDDLYSLVVEQRILTGIHFHDFSSHVVSAGGTDDVRSHGGTAFGTVCALDGRFMIV
jgi:hypothetical protein